MQAENRWVSADVSWSTHVWRILLGIPSGPEALSASERRIALWTSSSVTAVRQWCACGYTMSSMSSRSASNDGGKKAALRASIWPSKVWAAAPSVTSGGNLGESRGRWLSALAHLTSFYRLLESLQVCSIPCPLVLSMFIFDEDGACPSLFLSILRSRRICCKHLIVPTEPPC